MSPDGLTVCSSAFGPRETMDRLAAAVTKHGMAILARIDHADAAAKVGLKLRPTEVLMFGNPKAGTPLMQAVQTMGIDLPLRALIREDGAGRTWLAYNEPKWLAARHGADNGAEQILGATTAALQRLPRGRQAHSGERQRDLRQDGTGKGCPMARQWLLRWKAARGLAHATELHRLVEAHLRPKS